METQKEKTIDRRIQKTKKALTEALINLILKKDIMKNINLMSKLDIFSNYGDRPDKVVIGWENNILMKVNKYISLNISSMLIYDEKAIVAENTGEFNEIIQFKESFGVGFSYTIFH